MNYQVLQEGAAVFDLVMRWRSLNASCIWLIGSVGTAEGNTIGLTTSNVVRTNDFYLVARCYSIDLMQNYYFFMFTSTAEGSSLLMNDTRGISPDQRNIHGKAPSE